MKGKEFLNNKRNRDINIEEIAHPQLRNNPINE